MAGIEDAGYAGAGSIITGLLTYFGISRRLDSLENKTDKMILSETCNVCKGATHDRLDRIEGKQDETLRFLMERLK